MENITFNRKHLYDLVWSTPLTKLSKKYRVSFHQLRNACKKMDIPLPDYGHWMKLQHKKPIDIKDLQENCNCQNEVTFMIGNTDDSEKVVSERNKLTKEISSNKVLPFKVSSRLTNPDGLIVSAMNDLSPAKHHYANNGLIHTSGGLLDITVAPKNVGRALRFLDALIKLLKARGHDVIINNKGTCAVVFGEEITICLQEKLRIEESPNNYGWNSRQYFPSDILTFRMWMSFRFHQKVWGTGLQVIENQLPDILASLEILAKKEIAENIEREKRRKEREEELRIVEAIKERIENEYKQFKKLFRQANLLHKANILREYVKTVEGYAISNGELTEDLRNWITWATNKIDWFDPLINKEDPVLDDDFRKTIYREIKEGRI